MTIEHTGSLSEWLRKTISKLKSHLAELGYSEHDFKVRRDMEGVDCILRSASDN